VIHGVKEGRREQGCRRKRKEDKTVTGWAKDAKIPRSLLDIQPSSSDSDDVEGDNILAQGLHGGFFLKIKKKKKN